MSEEEIFGSLVVLKSPNTFMTEAGVLKREEKAFHCVLIVTSNRLIFLPTESSSVGWREVVAANFPMLLMYDIVKQTSTESEADRDKRRSAGESLDKTLKENEHFFIDFAYIEQLELQGSTTKLKVSWNPKYVDKQLLFSLVEPSRIEEFTSMLRSVLAAGFSETSRRSFIGTRQIWKRRS